MIKIAFDEKPSFIFITETLHCTLTLESYTECGAEFCVIYFE